MAYSVVKIIAVQSKNEKDTGKINEISGIAKAGFRDVNGNILLWAHEEDKERLMLLSARPGGKVYYDHMRFVEHVKLNDAEDMAIAKSNGGPAYIYIADTGRNNKHTHACVRYEHAIERQNICRITSGNVVSSADDKQKEKRKIACLDKGNKWLWFDEVTDLSGPGSTPAIWRFLEPTKKDVLARKRIHPDIIRFTYPDDCGTKACGEFQAQGLESHKGQYNTEAIAVVPEPDGSHTAYLFAKSHITAANLLKKQHPQAPGCSFESDGVADVFRIEYIDTLDPSKMHTASYLTSVDFSDDGPFPGTGSIRITAADYLPIDHESGFLALKTKSFGYKWFVTLERDDQNRAQTEHMKKFDIKYILETVRPHKLTCPETLVEKGTAGEIIKEKHEAFTQISRTEAFHIGECKNLSNCRLFYVRDAEKNIPLVR